MPSPFPGMDPFLEAHWGDVHTRLATYISGELRKQLPSGLKARIEESVMLEAVEDDTPDDATEKTIYPDVGLYDSGKASAGRDTSNGVLLAEPIITSSAYSERKQRTVVILDSTRKMKLVTAIEILSPSNKIGRENRIHYRERAELILESEASLVEMDFIRRGRHVMRGRAMPEKGHYAICVTRAWKPNRNEVYPARFDFPLPNIRIPLRQRDPDAVLELQKLIDRCYEEGDYNDLDYSQPLSPPFTTAENRWLKAQLKKRK